MHTRNRVSSLRTTRGIGFTLFASITVNGAWGDVFVDDFENDINVGGWTYVVYLMALTPDGGNPGGMLRAHLCCDTFVPMARTLNADTPFTGDFAARGVMTIETDVRIFAIEVGSPFVEYPLSLRILTDHGTPDDPTDDYGVRFQGGAEHATPPPPPSPLSVWKTITFEIPAQAKTLPAGWTFVHYDAIFASPPIPADASWEVAMQHVTGVAFDHGPEAPYWPLLEWDFAIDNVTIIDGGAGEIPGDIDGDGAVDFSDLLALLAAWGDCVRTCNEDLDDSGSVGFADLLILLAHWG